MGAHVFVVDKYSYPVHANKGFCGVKNPKGGGRLGLIADVKTYRVGDTVIFYHRRVDEDPLDRGFRDVFKIISEPFYDDSDVAHNGNKVLGKCPTCGYPYSGTQDFECSNPKQTHEIPHGQHILPYRVLIEPVMRFDKPVDDNTAYIDPEDEGELPTLRWRKVTGAGRARSAQHILPEESEKLIRLLKKVNDNTTSDASTTNYISVEEAEEKKIPPTLEIKRDTSGEPLFYVKRDGSFSGELGLEAWVLENIDKSVEVLKDVVGPLDELEYFGNGVQYGIGGEKVDVLLLHKRKGKRFKATVIELKKNDVDEDTINQVLDPTKQNYTKWVGLLATSNVKPQIDSLMIQPAMVGFSIDRGSIKSRLKELERKYKIFSEKILIKYPHRPEVKIEVSKPIFIEYKVVNGLMQLQKVEAN
jgi:hypothetical protein